MNDLLYAMMQAVNRDDPIDDLLPLDLSGYCRKDVADIMALYIMYGRDPDRVEVCRKKLQTGGGIYAGR